MTGHGTVRRLGTALAAAMLAAAAPATAQEPEFLSLSLGVFDVNDDQTAAEGRIEIRGDRRLWHFGPLAGLMVNSDLGLYGYGGVFLDVFFGRRVVVQPSFAVGGYVQGDSKDLGHVLEFRSQLEVAWRFDDRSRLGVALSHISNASLSDDNPGTESLVLTYSLPLGHLLD